MLAFYFSLNTILFLYKTNLLIIALFHSFHLRFYDIAWGCTSYKPQGVIAGALENGLLELWDAEALLDGSS